MSGDDFQLGGDRFAEALRSGVHRVILDQEELNRINVFPVADGDTGTNLSLSLGAMLPVLDNTGDRIDRLLVAVADALLDGARGNSGAIMAQFFQGLSDATVERDALDGVAYARAVELGSEYAHDAIADPKPGTILTVLASYSASLKEQLASGKRSLHALWPQSLAAAEEALRRTESQLGALRRAGVVDAGAKGFVVMLQGMTDHLLHGRHTALPEGAEFTSGEVHQTAGEEQELQFRFCTECMVSGDDIDRRKLRETLAALGNSLVVAGTKRKARVHVHVNDPDEVFEAARRFGRVSGEKADDMRRQQHSSHDRIARFAVICDSAADIADEDLERLDIHMVPVRIQFGDRGYLDKVSISPDEFFTELAANPVHPTTSQPAPGDFRRQYQFLASHFDDVISVSLSGSVSGTLQAAQAAAQRSGGRIHVVNTLNASTGQGLLAIFAAECAKAGMETEETLAALRALVPATLTFALVRDLRYAVRGGRIPGYVKALADFLHITPVLRTTPDGRVKARGALAGRRRPIERFSRYVSKHAPVAQALRMSIGHALCPDDARRLETALRERLPQIERSTICQLGSSIGVHGGPGTLVVALQPAGAVTQAS